MYNEIINDFKRWGFFVVTVGIYLHGKLEQQFPESTYKKIFRLLIRHRRLKQCKLRFNLKDLTKGKGSNNLYLSFFKYSPHKPGLFKFYTWTDSTLNLTNVYILICVNCHEPSRTYLAWRIFPTKSLRILISVQKIGI